MGWMGSGVCGVREGDLDATFNVQLPTFNFEREGEVGFPLDVGVRDCRCIFLGVGPSAGLRVGRGEWCENAALRAAAKRGMEVGDDGNRGTRGGGSLDGNRL